MQARETTLQPIIEGTKQYVVPLFQRSYSWERKDWEILWNDLVELCTTDHQRTHFIGSIVTIPTDSVPEGVAKYSLIDGQQRLTTIFILLSLLRDKARDTKQDELANEINDTLLVNRYKKGSDYFKFLPTQVDRTSFQDLIHASEITYQNQLINAYQFYERKFRQSGLGVQQLKQAITNDITIVSIVLDSDDNPHLVFESLNAKGRPLTQSDLIRNYLFMRVHVDEQDKIYSTYWKPMQDGLGLSLTEFIRHYLMKDGTVIRQNDVYFSLKEKVSKTDAIKYLEELTRFASHYEKLLHPARESNENIQQALIRLNRIEVTTSYPFLLNCYDDYASNKINEEEFISAIKVIENFMIRRFVCNIPTNPLNTTFAYLYTQIQSKKADGFVEGLKKSLQGKGYPKDTEFKARLMDAKLYRGSDRVTKTKLILETIDESFGHKEQVPFDKVTVEHVMPQTLTEWWQTHLGQDWEITHELLLHTLGNLTITKYNSELSNADFDSKKNLLKDSHFELNRYFEDKFSWRKEDIEARAEHLSDIALRLWPYFGDESTDPLLENDATGITPTGLQILGQHFVVESWRDVLEKTMNTIAELEPEKFEELVISYPRFVGRDQGKFRAIRTLSNGAFIEVNLSAKAIQRFCIQALEAIELTADDWIVEGNSISEEKILLDYSERDITGRTVDDYHLLLTRLPIPMGQQLVYKSLYEAGDKGLTATELEQRTGQAKHGLPGIMGALGRRVNTTPGIGQKKKPGICLLFEIVKADNESNEWHYKMLPELREALTTLNPTWLHN